MSELNISQASFPEGELDPQVAKHYEGLRFASPFGKLPIEKIRAAMDEVYNDKKKLVELFRVEDIWIDRNGAKAAKSQSAPASDNPYDMSDPLLLRLYLPSPGTHSVLLYFHGGGFVMHNVASHDNLCRKLAEECDALVVSVEYRLAPENPYPAALQDAWTALNWAKEHAAEYGGDPERIFAGGDSAGATISASLTFLTRDRKGPAMEGQILFYGVYGAVPLAESKTVELYGDGQYVLPREMLEACDEAYGYGTGELADYRDPGMCLNAATSTRTLMVTAEMDPLREDGEAFARLLAKAGDDVTCLRMRGMMHGFMLLWPEFDRCEEVFRMTAEFMNKK